MSGVRLLVVTVLVSAAVADPSAVQVLQDVYHTCLKDFSVSCAKSKALQWADYIVDKPLIRITEDLVIVKKDSPQVPEERGFQRDVMDSFDDFLLTHDIVIQPPAFLRPDGPFGSYVPRSFQADPIQVPLAATGRSSKLVKKVIFPFLLGLKFKTAVLVPLALTLIALKTWKAFTLGLISLVLSGAVALFSKFSKHAPTYEVVHYPQHAHIDAHHYDVPVPVVPAAVPLGWEHPVYRARRSAQEMAFGGQKH